ncbi:MAG: hypothetical protein KOO61_03795 [Spirochaetales bacterium]|nr:hypothetical protein [Spirochaetales bacterium]
MSYKQIVLTVILLPTLFVFASCSRSKTAEDGAVSDGEPVTVAPERQASPERPPVREGTDAAVPMRLTDQGRARAEQPVVAPADPRDTAFEAPRFTAVPFHPRDTILGPFGAAMTGSARDRAVLSASEHLFSSLLAGDLPTDALSYRIGPGGRAVFEDLIWAAETLSEVRLGVVVTMSDGEASVPFRLMGESRFAVGEVILEKLGDQWYTSDIQVEFFDRDTTSRFDPGVVRSSGNL